MAQIFIFFRLIFKKNYSPNNKKYSHKLFLLKPIFFNSKQTNLKAQLITTL